MPVISTNFIFWGGRGGDGKTTTISLQANTSDQTHHEALSHLIAFSWQGASKIKKIRCYFTFIPRVKKFYKDNLKLQVIS